MGLFLSHFGRPRLEGLVREPNPELPLDGSRLVPSVALDGGGGLAILSQIALRAARSGATALSTWRHGR
jgi:hypothetical protein